MAVIEVEPSLEMYIIDPSVCKIKRKCLLLGKWEKMPEEITFSRARGYLNLMASRTSIPSFDIYVPRMKSFVFYHLLRKRKTLRKRFRR